MTRRELIARFSGDELRNARISIALDDDEKRRYTLRHYLAHGKIGVTWVAVDRTLRPWAIKFTRQDEYLNHSLETEARRITDLEPDLFASLEFYGKPIFEDRDVDRDRVYAIVMPYIKGQTLREFLESTTPVDVSAYVALARDLCTAVHSLLELGVCHNDLHAENILIRSIKHALDGTLTYRICVIDTGHLKGFDKRRQLVARLAERAQTLAFVPDPPPETAAEIEDLRKSAAWFARTDEQWLVAHLCDLHNKLLRSKRNLDSSTKRFLRDLPEILIRAIDPDPGRRVSVEVLFQSIAGAQSAAVAGDPKAEMRSPFDLYAAEMIRSDRQLMELFRNEYPSYDACCRSVPTHLVGPRGCGKSTVFRSLSVKALLESPTPQVSLDRVPFFGVYISCYAEFRSRFLLIPAAELEGQRANTIRYFQLVLVEELLNTLDVVHRRTRGQPLFDVFISDAEASSACGLVAEHFDIRTVLDYEGASRLSSLALAVRHERDRVWGAILRKEEYGSIPDPHRVVAFSKDLEAAITLLQRRRLVFLLDDYSRQRIPPQLQRNLNETLTFARHAVPVFMVSSEYHGLNTEGITEGREKTTVNAGWVDAKFRKRNLTFLEKVIERRFEYLGAPIALREILPPSKLGIANKMAGEIRRAVEEDRRFYYHGIDSISDLCSGDFALAIELVRRMFSYNGVEWKDPRPITKEEQHAVIQEYSNQQFQQVRQSGTLGVEKADVVAALGWLSHQIALKVKIDKGPRRLGLSAVKNHLDIVESVATEAERNPGKLYSIWEELIREGTLFPLLPSRAREQHRGTLRYMVKHILLPKFQAPLGRDVPIKIERLQQFHDLLAEPMEFVDRELQTSLAEQRSDVVNLTRPPLPLEFEE